MTGSALRRWTFWRPLLLGEKKRGGVRGGVGAGSTPEGRLADDGKRLRGAGRSIGGGGSLKGEGSGGERARILPGRGVADLCCASFRPSRARSKRHSEGFRGVRGPA